MNKISLTTNVILMIAIIIVSLFFFKQCQTSASKNAEISRLENNIKASNDTLKTYTDKNNSLVAEISGYVFDKKKDKSQIQALIGENKSLKGLIAAGSGHAGSVTGGTIPTVVIQDTDLTGTIKLADSTVYNKTNFNKFYATTPYTLFTTKSKVIIGGDTTYTYTPYLKAGMSTYRTETALDLTFKFQEEKPGELKVIVETPNKSVKFSSLLGGVLKGEDLPASMRMSARKNWGLGFSAGAGIGYDPFTNVMMPCVYLGIGINYTPKKIQF